MRELIFRHEGKDYERISKRAARKAFEEGIFICPCNLRPFGMPGFAVFIKDCGRSFESIVNEFEALNCVNGETGRYAAFYKEI